MNHISPFKGDVGAVSLTTIAEFGREIYFRLPVLVSIDSTWPPVPVLIVANCSGPMLLAEPTELKLRTEISLLFPGGTLCPVLSTNCIVFVPVIRKSIPGLS